MRSGDVPLLSGGTLIPTSTALLFPESDPARTPQSPACTARRCSRTSSCCSSAASTPGSLQRSPVHGRRRHRSLHEPVARRAAGLGPHVPPWGEGVIFSVLKGATPAVTLGLIESTEPGFFENGATFMWNTVLPVKLSKTLPGGSAIGGEIGSFEGTSLDQSPWMFIPPLNVPLARSRARGRSTSPSISSCGCTPTIHAKAWASSACSPCPTATRASCARRCSSASAARRPFEGRSMDSFGAAFYYNDVSNDLENTLEPVPAGSQRAGRRALLLPGRQSAGAA